MESGVPGVRGAGSKRNQRLPEARRHAARYDSTFASGGESRLKAVYIERTGGPEELRFGELPDPVPKPGEIVVDIAAASVNAADWKVRSGRAAQPPRFPHVLGRDFSGVVASVGEGVADFRVGDRVFAVCDTGQEGAYAEKIAIKAAIVAKIPATLAHPVAAAHALAGLTALVALEDTLHLARGETILIQGGAGGVAGFAIQLAKHIGARVVTTASAGNHAYVRGLGADQVIDYNAVDVGRAVSGCDAVLDPIGGDVTQRSFAVLRPGGRAAFIFGMQAPRPERSDVTSLKPDVRRDRPHLERIVDLVERGAIRPPEIRRFALADAAAAHRISESGHLRGKLVFDVR
jgi:NADPH:quinone reductase-like Zn-dependent oxidoreductase